MPRNKLGSRLRALREKTGRGLKQVAPDLGITYTYLSKLENDEKVPSQDLIERVARYYSQDPSELTIAAGHVPPDVMDILRREPERAVAFLRERFGRRKS